MKYNKRKKCNEYENRVIATMEDNRWYNIGETGVLVVQNRKGEEKYLKNNSQKISIRTKRLN